MKKPDKIKARKRWNNRKKDIVNDLLCMIPMFATWFFFTYQLLFIG